MLPGPKVRGFRHGFQNAARCRRLEPAGGRRRPPSSSTTGARALACAFQAPSAGWVVHYTVDGKRRRISLGDVASLALAAARRKAGQVVSGGRDGSDPLKEQRLARGRELTHWAALDRALPEPLRRAQPTAANAGRDHNAHCKGSPGATARPAVGQDYPAGCGSEAHGTGRHQRRDHGEPVPSPICRIASSGRCNKG